MCIRDSGERVYAPVNCGDHLFAQTAQTFRYLRERLEDGSLQLPDLSLIHI